MNPYAILGVLLGFAALGSWATYETGLADKWEGKYDSLKASYADTAQKAKDDAKAKEDSDLADLKKQSGNAIQQASSATSKANAVKAVYLKKISDFAKLHPDLAHECAGVPMPEDDKP